MREQREIIQDFSGGLNSRFSANRIAPNESPSFTNVWYDGNALSQRNGSTSITFNPTSSATSFFCLGSNLYRYSLGGGTNDNLLLYVSANISPVVAEGAGGFFMTTSDAVTFTALSRGATGTASIASGQHTVTISGGSNNALAGDAVFVGNHCGNVTQAGNPFTTDAAWTATVNNSAYTVSPGLGHAVLDYSPVVISMNSNLYVTKFAAGATQVTPFQWNGSVATSPSGIIPSAFCGIVYQNYVFLANQNLLSSRISWSALKDPTTYPASNFIDINPQDGQGIVGLFLDGQGIVVLKKTSAFKIVGSVFDPSNPSYSVSPIYTPPDFQVNSGRTVQLFNGTFIVFGRFGFYTYDGYTFKKLPQSDQVESYMTNTGYSLGDLPPGSDVEPYSLIVDGNYWVIYPFTKNSGGPSKNSALMIDKNFKIWYWKFADLGNFNDLNYLNGSLYGIQYPQGGTFSSYGGLLNLNIGATDSGTAISGTWTSKVFEYPETQLFLRAYVHFKKQSSGTLTFGYRFDDSASFTTVSVDMTTGKGSGQRLISSIILLGQTGNTIQFQLSNSTNNQTFEVYAIEFLRRPQEQ